MSSYLYFQLAIAGGVLGLGCLFDILRSPSDWNPLYLWRRLKECRRRRIERRQGCEHKMSELRKTDNRILDAVWKRFDLIVRVLTSISAAGLVTMSIIISQADPSIWECLSGSLL